MGRNTRTERKGRKRDEEAHPRKRLRVLEGLKKIDVNNIDLLRQCVTEHGKVMPSRLTGATAKQQRQIRRGVMRARVLGLI